MSSKILIVGPKTSGKSSLVKTLVENTFELPNLMIADGIMVEQTQWDDPNTTVVMTTQDLSVVKKRLKLGTYTLYNFDGVNDKGRFIWRSTIVKSMDMTQILKRLETISELDEKNIRKDLNNLINEIKSQ